MTQFADFESHYHIIIALVASNLTLWNKNSEKNPGRVNHAFL